MRVGRGFQVSGHFFLCFDHSKPLQVSSLQHTYRLFLVLPSTPKPTQLLVWSDLTLGWSNLTWSDPTVERNGHNLVISPAQLLISIMLLMLCQINHCMWVVVGGGGGGGWFYSMCYLQVTYKTNSCSHVGDIPFPTSVSRVTFWRTTRTNELCFSEWNSKTIQKVRVNWVLSIRKKGWYLK